MRDLTQSAALLGWEVVAPGVGDRPLSPLGGDRPPFHFFSAMDLVANLKKKKLHLGHVAPHKTTGGSFEIFQNGHIFLKF